MKRVAPSVALIWMYQGKDADQRRQQIDEFKYSSFTLIDAGAQGEWAKAVRSVPAETEVCVFWIDDDKPVGTDFLDEMTRPLITSKDLRAVMHFWSGNALSLPKKMLDSMSIDGNQDGIHSLLRLLLPALDSAETQLHGRLQLAFSSTERLAPLSMEPVGSPS